ncbi:pre-mRNA-splicing factor SYF1, putative [Plasmodium ovale]|uniref:Pre-mRNA-splicing factor SYF1 n=2 Tax=Plasmodium ovale TaxID=36330 RepID=A0A1A8WZV0_PLAOA|nr:pre-mRNA-splicing factor SYF1, putative (XAB2) [Plasmodium ovale curtisi]SBS98519.1 pre-mRNA-splicing factor SYF1, putative (XAB2) [Plasmodium ovale curtisi]SCQ17170.1 pre-mRNA-splicing factor SYF1, putative [Plasmodium ovale]
MELYGEFYDCDDFFSEEGLQGSSDQSAECCHNKRDEDSAKYLKNIEFDIKNNLEKVSTKYLFLYINKFKEKHIRNINNLYELKFYDLHLKKDPCNILETENNVVEYCLTHLDVGDSRPNWERCQDIDEHGKGEMNNTWDHATSSELTLFGIYETILKYFPYSFKLWYHYLKDSIELIREIYYDNNGVYKRINKVFEKCLLYMYHFKAIYIMYIQFLYIQRDVKKIREIFNRSLQNVFLNQHEHLWEYQLKYVQKVKNKLINYEYIKRYVTIYPEHVIFLFNHYLKYKMHKHAISTFFYILNCDESTLELGNVSKYDLFKEILNLVRSSKVLTNDVMEILKNNLNIFKNYENVTAIYILLANNFVYEGRWNKAMDAYEEGISECYSLNDFTILFENYIETIKVLIELKIRQGGNATKSEVASDETDEHFGDDTNAVDDKHNGDDFLIDLYLDKINYLLDKRKMLIADIKLKNNQKNVYIWLGKIDAVEEKTEKIEFYNKCLKHFEGTDYIGRLSDLYISYAYYHYNHDEYEEALKVFNRAIRERNFKSISEMANIFCAWIEMELLQKNYKEALNIARLSIDIGRGKPPKGILQNGADIGNNVPVKATYNLLSSIKLVCLVLDMEINYGTVETALNMFDLLYHSKSITVKMVLSFSSYLYENKYFNECFKVYEKAMSIFHYPYVYPIYVTYINKYIARYKDKNISYVRELFKQAIYGLDNKTYVPKEFARHLFLMYADFEEKYGFLKKALAIYKEAIPFLEETDKIKFYKVFISKVSKSYGVHKARESFEEAIQTLRDDDAREICLLYIDMECKLNEYERVRALYIYTAQFTNPATFPNFYQDWREFEALHGNEHTFRDMIRIKRSVLNIFTNSRNGTRALGTNEATVIDGIESTKRKLKEIIEKEEENQKKLKKV